MKIDILRFPKSLAILVSFFCVYIFQVARDSIEDELISEIGIGGSSEIMNFELLSNDVFWINIFERIETLLYLLLILASVKLIVVSKGAIVGSFLRELLIANALTLIGVTIGLSISAPQNLSFNFYVMYAVIPVFGGIINFNALWKGKSKNGR